MKHAAVVLVVDNQDVYDHMAPIIAEEMNTTHVLHRSSEEGALDLIRTHQPLDMVFCDWETAGASFIAALRHDPETHFTPLVVMSDSDRDDIIADAMRAGATDHLAKPFLPKGLVAKIRRVTKNQERRRQRRVRPVGEYRIEASFSAGVAVDLELINISIGGCQTRAPGSLCRAICVYDEVQLTVTHEADTFTCNASVLRLAKDPQAAAPGASLLVTLEFGDLGENSERLVELLDDLREQWQPEE